MIDPGTWPIKGDLSRSDVMALWELAYNCEFIIEYGAGGSSIILAHTGAHVEVWESDNGWTERTKRNIELFYKKYKKMYELHKPKYSFCPITYLDQESTEKQASGITIGADPGLVVIDGLSAFRIPVLKGTIAGAKPGTKILYHDCRKEKHYSPVVDVVKSYMPKIRSFHFAYKNSNYILIETQKEVKYENWNDTEKYDNRINWWDKEAI